jgi:hypothetical protein
MSQNEIAEANRHKWFDLQSFRGWVEAVGALVTVIGGAVGIYHQVFSAKDDPSKTTANPAIVISAPVTGMNVVGSQNVIQMIQGYTIEQHEERLKVRENELRADFQAAQGQSEERRKAIERELQDVTNQLHDSQKSYVEKLSELKYLAGELDALRGQGLDAKIDAAAKALRQGETKLADEIVTGAKSAVPAGTQTAVMEKTLDLSFPTQDLQFPKQDLQFSRQGLQSTKQDMEFTTQDLKFFIETTDK